MIKQLCIAGSLLLLSSTATLNASVKVILPYDLSPQDIVKLEVAKGKLYKGQYKNALVLFKEILSKNQNDGVALFYTAECHYMLGEYEQAMDLLKKSKESSNPKNETFFRLGVINFYNGKIDEALTEFTTYKSKASSKEGLENDVDVLISHCNNAKKLMASPVDVKVTNAGNAINSQYDDATPSISADGRKLVFNSRRPETTDAPMDIEGDGKYFQDIYIATWDTVNMKWNTAESVPGQVNTEGAHDACTGISPDGKEIFIYRNNNNDPESRGGDIFVSKVSNNKWKTPVSLGKPINTTYWEGGACISPDGKTLFFTSERKGGFGHSDIWMVKKKTKTEWDKPVNLGSDINTEFDEAGIFLSPDGKTLFFSSNGPNSMGSHDIFRSQLVNDKWGKPVNLGYPINTERSDGPFVISTDTKKAYIASDRSGGLGERDIYVIDLKDYAVLEPDFKIKGGNNELSILKGMVRDGFEGKGMDGAEVVILGDNGDKIASTTTNENGEYFITLKGNVKYNIKVEKKGYTTLMEKIDLPSSKSSEAFTLEKQFLLNKEK
jgi:Tol biopolymer transport system component